jgi:conjugative transfer pilus assembly protein TraH
MFGFFRRMAKQIVPALCGLIVLSGTVSAYADVESNMDDFWDNSVVNVTGPAYVQGQQYGYYTVGSLNYRTEQSNLQFGSIKMPSVRAGCGGIDVFGGGFSFINSDQLVAVLKNMATNAVGLLFQMAIDSLSELLGTNIKDFMSKLQNATNRSINSCEAAQNIISGLVNSVSSESMKTCIEVGVNNGTYSDYSQAFAKCGAGGEAEAMAKTAPADKKATQSINRNIAWEALNRVSMFSGDTELKETMMTLTGTSIVRYDSDDKPSYDFKSPQGDQAAIIRALMDGGTLQVWQCQNTSDCLVINGMKTITIDQSSALKFRVRTMLNSIVQKLKDRQNLTAAETAFVNSAPLPVFKMASVNLAASKGNIVSAQMAMGQYADYLATLIVLQWVETGSFTVIEASNNLVGLNTESRELWLKNLSDMRQNLHTEQEKASTQMASIETVIQRYTELEEQVMARSSRFTQAVAWAGELKASN